MAEEYGWSLCNGIADNTYKNLFCIVEQKKFYMLQLIATYSMVHNSKLIS